MTRKLAGLLAVVALLGLAGSAAAAEMMQPVQIIKGKPGEVTFDARGANKLFPLPSEMRQFDSEEDYFKFLEADLNAELVRNDKGEIVDYNLGVTTLGASYYWDYGRGEWANVPDFQAYYVGGTSGYVLIDKLLRCIYPAICMRDRYYPAGARSPSGLYTIEVEASLPTWEETVGGKTKVHRMWKTTITKPDAAKLLGLSGCHLCFDVPGVGEQCTTFACPNVPTLWEIEVTRSGYRNDGLPCLPETVSAQNEIEVTYTLPFAPEKDTEFDYKCAVVQSRGETFAPFQDVAEAICKYEANEGDCGSSHASVPRCAP